MKRIHLVIHGHVQGVGFRFFVQQAAVKYNVNGWVRNREDGSVELEAQADERSLSAFVAAVKQGPRFSKVTNWEINQKKPDPSLESFQVRYG